MGAQLAKETDSSADDVEIILSGKLWKGGTMGLDGKG